ncbi:helix-turn-helix domain-containing protein [Catellatospora coxensis]
MDEGVIDRVRSVITRVSPSQAAFSELVGISADKLSKSLNAVRRFTSLELALIADAGDVSVDWLLTGRTREPALPGAEPNAGDEIRALVDRYATAYERLRLLGRRPALPTLPEPPAGRPPRRAAPWRNRPSPRYATPGCRAWARCPPPASRPSSSRSSRWTSRSLRCPVARTRWPGSPRTAGWC